MTHWTFGRGLLGPLKPLIGAWRFEGEHNGQAVVCTRTYAPFGKGWVRLEAVWALPGQDYVETAFYGPGEDGALGFYSFTNDGRKSVGALAEGTDVHPRAVAFVAKFPAGTGRMIAWPADDGEPGFCFAVESRTKKGWNRFLLQRFRPV